MAGLSHGLRAGLDQICRFLREGVRLFMPPLCTVCGTVLEAREKWLCRSCMAGLAAGSAVMVRRLELPGGCDLKVRYALEYRPAVSRLIRDLKYGDRPGLSEVLAPFIAFALHAEVFTGPVLIPVPLHAAKRRERGYNQSEILARAAGRMTGIETVSGALVRLRNTASQTSLGAEKRPANVRNAFAVRNDPSVRGKHVILIDDVVTTGATLSECARVLLGSGVSGVTGCVVASSD
jgi:competence protein ComFC